MSLKNQISKLIEQQLDIEYHNNYLAYTIHNWAASEISNSIALCIVGCGDCKIKYQGIANSFNITKEEIEQGDIVNIENKIKNEARKEGSEFSELISKMDQSLKEQSEKSIIQILNSSAEEMLKSFCGVVLCKNQNIIIHPLLCMKSPFKKVQKLLLIKSPFQPNQCMYMFFL